MAAFTKHEKNGIFYFTSPLFDCHKIPHAFFERYGGISSGDFMSLNVSLSRKDKNGLCDSKDSVRENILRMLSVFGIDEERASFASQIHSNKVQKASIDCKNFFEGKKPEFQSCDGLYTQKDDPIQALFVKTADCVPILLANTDTGSVCAVHAGWRGTVSDIVGNAVSVLSEASSPEKIIAAIGPCICRCCYEVNDKVYLAAKEIFGRRSISDAVLAECFPETYFSDGETKYKADLPRINKALFMCAGVPEENIDISELCTCCYTENGSHPFFSHRYSGGHSGTQASLIIAK